MLQNVVTEMALLMFCLSAYQANRLRQLARLRVKFLFVNQDAFRLGNSKMCTALAKRSTLACERAVPNVLAYWSHNIFWIIDVLNVLA